MNDMMLCSQPAPERARTRARSTVQRRLAFQNALGDDGSVAQLGGEPAERAFRIQYRGYNADKLAREMDALFGDQDVAEVAYYGVDGSGSHVQTQEDGYYALGDAASDSPDPRIDDLPFAEGSMRRVGTRKSHWRAIKTAPYRPENANPFGNVLESHVALPASASRARWRSREPPGVEAASPAATRTGEWGDVEVYDAESASWGDPTLICDYPYEAEGKFDPVVWDAHGTARAADVDGRTVVEWERVYNAAREPEGVMKLSNGLVRVTLDDDGGSMGVEEWDDGLSTPAWSSVALGASSWYPSDVDLRVVGQHRVWGYVTFTDGSAEYDLRMTLQAGYLRPLWTVPDHASSTIPTGLQDKLEPVASDLAYIPMATRTVVPRKEVHA